MLRWARVKSFIVLSLVAKHNGLSRNVGFVSVDVAGSEAAGFARVMTAAGLLSSVP